MLLIEPRKPVKVSDDLWFSRPGLAAVIDKRFGESGDLLLGVWRDEAGYLLLGASRKDDEPEQVDMVLTASEHEELKPAVENGDWRRYARIGIAAIRRANRLYPHLLSDEPQDNREDE